MVAKGWEVFCGAIGFVLMRRFASQGGTLKRIPNQIMKLILTLFATSGFVIAMLINAALATDLASVGKSSPTNVATEAQTNNLCPISGKPVNPGITLVYEGRTWSFAEEACRTKFNEARESSLYQKLGGKAAIDAAVELFYKKVLADNRVKHFFDDVNMTAQRRRQKDFLSAALGSPVPWTGKDMRKAHEDLSLEESHFNAIAENLVATLTELKIPQDLIDQVVAVVLTVKDDVLNRPAKAQ
jgi:hemoglobin